MEERYYVEYNGSVLKMEEKKQIERKNPFKKEITDRKKEWS